VRASAGAKAARAAGTEPATSSFTIVSVGALLAQLLVLHEDVIHCIVLAVILAAVVWTQREQLRAMRG
jgi:hypothetical protein